MLELLFGGRHLVFESPLTFEEATQRLERELTAPTANKRWRAMGWRASEQRPPSLHGTFADDRFQMSPLINGRRSLRPWIVGTLSRAAIGCRVDVRLKMPTLAVVVHIPFMIVGALFAVYVRFLALPGLLLVLAPILISTLVAQKSTELLAKLFEAKPSRAASLTADPYKTVASK
jgi:hypothetical protein